MQNTPILRGNQQGMTSFMVTTVLILVIGLILTGFSQSAQRNQRETLDRQLSTQAFYAAESGVNQAAAIANKAILTGSTVVEKDDCAPNLTYPAVEFENTEIEVTCVLVDASLETLYYSSVTEDEGSVVPVLADENFVAIELTWQSSVENPQTGCVANMTLPPKANWNCGYGMLRADVTTIENLATSDFAMSQFFKPTVNGGTPSVGYAPGGGGLSYGYCDADRCVARITGFTTSSAFLRLRSIYQNSSVSVNAINAAGENVDLSGQTLIDVTARAQDVLRRVQVRVPLRGFTKGNVPIFAVESTGSLCKRFSVAPGYYESDALICDEADIAP